MVLSIELFGNSLAVCRTRHRLYSSHYQAQLQLQFHRIDTLHSGFRFLGIQPERQANIQRTIVILITFLLPIFLDNLEKKIATDYGFNLNEKKCHN